MKYPNLPVPDPQPDVKGWIDHLMGRRILPTPLVEFIVDDEPQQAVVTGLLGRDWAPYGADRASQVAYLDNLIVFWRSLGYSVIRYERGLNFPGHGFTAVNTAGGARKQRSWADEHGGSIGSWEDFERYPFPRIEDFDFFPFEYLSNHLPEGMGLLLAHGGGIFEHLSWIFSIEKLCLALYDAPDLVKAVVDRIGELQYDFYRHLVDLPGVVGLFPGDDMGFRSATLISPADLRRLIFPWHSRIAELSHARDMVYLLHSCGNVTKVMDDLIETVRIDGKHSFEDAILPAPAFQERFGNRVATLGGMDVHLLATATPEQVRARTRTLIQTCAPNGRFAIGSGNSIPDYVPVVNYLAMVDETLAIAKETEL